MKITDYHAKYYAYELAKKCSNDSVERLSATLLDAQVDLNPHQVEAALFAFKSPLSKGAILADEVGLGKTIEAGLVISQKWAEKKKKILIIVPSNLRKQWNQELLEKFFLPSVLLEAKSFNKAIKDGATNPFEHKDIVITSYHFARNKSEFVSTVPWDLVVIDEAHRLRNVYRPTNVIANEIKRALQGRPKILLTATPLQNSLLELYGLTSIIDDYIFGSLDSYKSQFVRIPNKAEDDEEPKADNFKDLKERLSQVCIRTLRRQVLEYIRYTNRIPITEEFTPTDEEQQLYDEVSGYLQRTHLKALPNSQRHLMTMILRKLLASSSFAIAKTLNGLIAKLDYAIKTAEVIDASGVTEDLDDIDDYIDEWQENGEKAPEKTKYTAEEIQEIVDEKKDLERFRDLAESIQNNAKGFSLLTALTSGFSKTRELGANEKVVIFTESRRTQEYLYRFLSENGYDGQVVLFNGTNSDDKSKEIYRNWYEKHQGTDRVTGSKTADTRAAITDYFRDSAKIMLATEAAAEGMNLQFCSLVVNYDLPWNPQRIEQRIGRCHRYGQKHDVVVINFLNKKNAADQRVYELLQEKFQLFNGVFGASDEVLGSIESGIDFEKRIAQIYQNCRTTTEINTAFDELQNELEEQINEKMKNTRRKLLENFDEEVGEKLRLKDGLSRESLSKYEDWLWRATRHYLGDKADFYDDEHVFELKTTESPEKMPLGRYRLGRSVEDAHKYRLHHPLAQQMLHYYSDRKLPAATIKFDYTGTKIKISILEKLIGKEGYLSISNLNIKTFEDEDYLMLAGVTSDGKRIDPDQIKRLFSLNATLGDELSEFPESSLDLIKDAEKNIIIEDISTRDMSFFEEEMVKLEKWSDDKKESLKNTLRELDKKIKELKKESRLASSLPEKLKVQKEILALERNRDEAWRKYDVEAKTIDDQREDLLNQIEARLKQEIKEEKLFNIKWQVV